MTRSASVDTQSYFWCIAPLTLILMLTDQTDKDNRFCGFCCVTGSSSLEGVKQFFSLLLTCNHIPLYPSKDKKNVSSWFISKTERLTPMLSWWISRTTLRTTRFFHHFPNSSAYICSLYVLQTTAVCRAEVTLCHHDGIQLTVLNGDFAFPVVSTQYGLIEAPLLDHGADCALAVWAVIGGVLTQLQGCLISYRNRWKLMRAQH